MINYDYKQFIKEINSGVITEMYFAVHDYAHYKNCYIKRFVDVYRDGSEHVRIVVSLHPDGEGTWCYTKFEEDRKLFKMGRQGTFTLKGIWNKLDIYKIVYGEQ